MGSRLSPARWCWPVAPAAVLAPVLPAAHPPALAPVPAHQAPPAAAPVVALAQALAAQVPAPVPVPVLAQAQAAQAPPRRNSSATSRLAAKCVQIL